MMRILHTVESYLPSRHGMQEVVTQISRYIASLGHDVTIATSFDERRTSLLDGTIKIQQFNIRGNYTLGYAGDTSAYVDYLLSSNFDIIVNFAAQQWATDLMLPLLDDIKGKKFFVPTGFSALYNPLYTSYYDSMKLWMPKYDCNIFLSSDYRDINFAKENGVTRNVVIPNGANLHEFEQENSIDIRKELGISASTKLLLSVGGHTGYKGHGHLFKIFRKLKNKDVALLIIGNNTSHDSTLMKSVKNVINLIGLRRSLCYYSCKWNSFRYKLIFNRKKIWVKSVSREFTVNAYRQADLFLFPSLVECSPIVLFEAMAGRTAFAVSDVGNSREIISWTSAGVLLPTSFSKEGYSLTKVEESTELIDQLLKDDVLREAYAKNGNDCFVQQFTWEKISQRYIDLYKSVYSETCSF